MAGTVFLYTTNAMEAPISDLPRLILLPMVTLKINGVDMVASNHGLLVDIVTFGSFRRFLVAYKNTEPAMSQATHTPIETTNTAGSISPTISSMVNTLDALLRVYCVFRSLWKPDFV